MYTIKLTIITLNEIISIAFLFFKKRAIIYITTANVIGTAKELYEIEVLKSNLSNANQALVVPHVGQGIPVKYFIGQVMSKINIIKKYITIIKITVIYFLDLFTLILD